MINFGMGGGAPAAATTPRTNARPASAHRSCTPANVAQAAAAGQSVGSRVAGSPGSIRGSTRQASITRRYVANAASPVSLSVLASARCAARNRS